MTYRPRPNREALVLAAVDLAMTDEGDLAERGTDELRVEVLAILLEALGVPEERVALYGVVAGRPLEVAHLSRTEVAEALVGYALVLDEADTMELDGQLLRDRLQDAATVDQRGAELDHVRTLFRRHVDAVVESLPPATIARP